jgi:prephenate dehydrogenase
MKIAILGVGHIGGSMAISLKENGFATQIIGVDKSQISLDKALRRRIIDEAMPLDAALEMADFVVVALPMDVVLDVLPEILSKISKKTVVLDVGSTKKVLLKTVENHPNRSRFVATHPMAGTEFSGIEAAIPNLFSGKYTVFCDSERSDADAVAKTTDFYAALDMKIVRMSAAEHDLHTAYISHISHLSSFALALTVLEKEKNEARIFELASSGFASTVRLAKSSPAMWLPIFRQNRENLLDVLDEHLSVLTDFRQLLATSDFEKIEQKMTEANGIRRVLEGK